MTRRVLILTDVLGGGTGNHLFSMLRHWEGSEWQFSIVSQAPPFNCRVSPHVMTETLRRRVARGRYPLRQMDVFWRIARRVAKNPPDLLHAYFFWAIIYGRMLRQLGLVKVLIENREDEGFSWGRGAYSLLRATRDKPDMVICVADAVRRVALERERLRHSRTVVIHNGVHPHVDRATASTVHRLRKELGLGPHESVVGMVSNFNRPVKGVTYLLDAVPRIVEAVPNARFLLLGGGDEEVALRQKAGALGVATKVLFAGFRDSIDDFYSIMDVSVLTSLSEGLSLTLLESMNHGLPVVATAVGGNPEVVRNGETGHLVPPRDPTALADCVISLLRNPEERRRLGNAGRERVIRHFAVGDTARQYLDVYRRSLAQDPAVA